MLDIRFFSVLFFSSPSPPVSRVDHFGIHNISIDRYNRVRLLKAPILTYRP